MEKLINKVDKRRVKEVVQSLKSFNRNILEQNDIEEIIDDIIFLNVKFSKNIE